MSIREKQKGKICEFFEYEKIVSVPLFALQIWFFTVDFLGRLYKSLFFFNAKLFVTFTPANPTLNISTLFYLYIELCAFDPNLTSIYSA